MREAGIGRVLVASLHQGIADLLPSRLEFYENWLNPEGLRRGTIGLAPLKAVLSFLRQEGEPYYNRVMAHAGTYAAEWLLAARRLPPRAVFCRLPAALRTRISLRTAGRLVRACYRGNGVAVHVRDGRGVVEIRDSVFCAVREPADVPLCGFYVALTARIFKAYGMPCELRTSACQGMGAPACELIVTTRAEPAAATEKAEPEVVP